MNNKEKPQEFFWETSVHIKSILGYHISREKYKEILKKTHSRSYLFASGEFKNSFTSPLLKKYTLKNIKIQNKTFQNY